MDGYVGHTTAWVTLPPCSTPHHTLHRLPICHTHIAIPTPPCRCLCRPYTFPRCLFFVYTHSSLRLYTALPHCHLYLVYIYRWLFTYAEPCLIYRCCPLLHTCRTHTRHTLPLHFAGLRCYTFTPHTHLHTPQFPIPIPPSHWRKSRWWQTGSERQGGDTVCGGGAQQPAAFHRVVATARSGSNLAFT